MKKTITLLSILLIVVLLSANVIPLQAEDRGCKHLHTTTEYHDYYSQYNSVYHSWTKYELTICTECFQIINTATVSGYPKLEVHPKVITGSPGVHTGIYSHHYFIYYEDCYTCGYHFQEHRSTHCTPNACNEPDF